MLRPLDRLNSIKVKLGVVIVATVVGTVMVLALGRRAGLDLEWRVVLAAALGLAMVQFLARGMTSPLREMAAAASAMARGDYDRRVRATSRDEVGELARAFNAMASDLADVERMRRDLVANVSHELRTPIASLQALLENLADGVEPTDPAALRLRGARQHGTHARPVVPRGGGDDGDRPTVELPHPAGDREAQARAAACVLTGAETVEDAVHLVHGDAGPVVAHLERPHGGIHGCRHDVHLAVLWAVPHRVVDEVGHQLVQARRVRAHGQLGRLHDGAHADRPAVHAGLGDDVVQKLGHHDVGELERRGAGIDAREVEEVTHEGTQPLRLAQGRPKRLVVGADDPVDEVLQQRPLGAEGGAQLVRDGGDEQPSLLVCRGQVRRHRVEGTGELPDLVRGRRGDALTMVAARHGPRRGRHLAQRRGHPAGEPLGHGQGGGHGDGQADPAGHARGVTHLRHHGSDHDAHSDEQAELRADRPDAVERSLGVHDRASSA